MSELLPNEPVILPYAEMAKKAERDGVDIMVYVNTMHAHVVSQRHELAKLNAQNQLMREAIDWVCKDMGYKAPETYPQMVRVWWDRLLSALDVSERPK